MTIVLLCIVGWIACSYVTYRLARAECRAAGHDERRDGCKEIGAFMAAMGPLGLVVVLGGRLLGVGP